MAERKFNSWDFESGLKPEFELGITEARFGYDSNYNSGQTLCLILEGTDGEGDEQRLLFSCGAGWEPAEGGARAAREDGSDRRTFNRSSGIGYLGKAAVEVGAPLEKRGEAFEAKVWTGLRFRFERQTTGQGQYASERPLPVEYLGEGAVPMATTSPTATTATSEDNSKVSRVMEVKLKKLAKEARDFDDFLEKGLELAAGNGDLEALVADEAWFTVARS
jgi:hypothetical protein